MLTDDRKDITPVSELAEAGVAQQAEQSAEGDGSHEPSEPSEHGDRDGACYGAWIVDSWLRAAGDRPWLSPRLVGLGRSGWGRMAFSRPPGAATPVLMSGWAPSSGSPIGDPGHRCHAPPFIAMGSASA